MLTRLLVALAVLGALSSPAVATTVDETAIDIKTREVAKTLRCTVCQTENVWESGSPFAQQSWRSRARWSTAVEPRSRACA